MTSLLSGRYRPLLAAALLMAVILGAMTAAHAAGLTLGRPLSLGLLGLTLVGALWLGGLYWNRIDEAAREAQKTAYFWGASGGAIVGVGVVSFLGYPATAGLTDWLTHIGPRPNPFLIGALIVVLVQTVGFLLGWAIWWGARR